MKICFLRILFVSTFVLALTSVFGNKDKRDTAEINRMSSYNDLSGLLQKYILIKTFLS